MKHTSQGIRINKKLRCGCCWLDFKVWEEYKNQDQDRWYGICKECQGIEKFSYIQEIEKYFNHLLVLQAIKNNKIKNISLKLADYLSHNKLI